MKICVDKMTVKKVNQEMKDLKKKYKTVHLTSKGTKSGIKTYIIFY